MTALAASKARVLFVDDEPRVLTTMRMLFRNQYEVFFSDSGTQALDVLKSQNIDVIVSDQRMPGMTGIELLRQARELKPNAMRILLTGYSDLNAVIGSINEGEIFRFVNKPWANDALSETVARAVAAARESTVADMALIEGTGSNTSAAALAETLPGVLVMDDDARMPAHIQRILGAEYRVFGAATMADAVDLLEREKIGVVLSDTRVQEQPVLDLIGTLKQHHPQLVSVILTAHADAAAAIDLINRGQIYRLITKPIHDSACKITVAAAFKQHERLVQAPELTRRYEVAPLPEPVAAAVPPVATRLLDRIRALRSWVTGRS